MPQHFFLNLINGLFLRSRVCIWNFHRYFMSKLRFLSLMTVGILGPNNSLSQVLSYALYDVKWHPWLLLSKYRSIFSAPTKM